jgi:signal transduction histidine kinase
MDRVFPGSSELAARMRAFDWSETPLGPPEGWPENLRTALGIILTSRFPMNLWWGPSLTLFYNDAYVSFLGKKHPHALGRPGREAWAEIWDTIGPMIDRVLSEGTASWSEDILMFFDRSVPKEEVYVTFSFSPIRGDDGGTQGLFCACTETTGKLIGARRLDTLRRLNLEAAEAGSAFGACAAAAAVLSDNPHDVPFVAIYLADEEKGVAVRAACAGVDPEAALLPTSVSLDAATPDPIWPLARVLRTKETVDVSPVWVTIAGNPWEEPGSAGDGRSPKGGALEEEPGSAGDGRSPKGGALEEEPGSAGDGRSPKGGALEEEPVSAARILPIYAPVYERLAGLLVVGASPRRVLDDDYQSFFALVAGHVGTAIADARAYEAERRRAEALTELDQAKTAFFSNVSHEFRTPLTLMLGPVGDALRAERLQPEDQGALEMVHRNGLRLLRLVNTLLDFSRLEADRTQAAFAPTDLSQLTADLASIFRAAVEAAGLRLIVDCQPLGEPAYVDREHWEKIVLNLVSNAFKFTFEGQIEVRMERVGLEAVLSVSDTGTGIELDQMRHLFKRFHRIRGARSRTHEGTGIGLALVHELTRLHGGKVEVESEPGRGSTFRVRLRLGKDHLPQEKLARLSPDRRLGPQARYYLQEASGWILEAQPDERIDDARPRGTAEGRRILVADDNVDVLEYVRRLLGAGFEVETARNGQAALEAARRAPPDLVIADAMMPVLDGFGLLAALRQDEPTRDVPVVMLSARAGEEARIEGLRLGADDYLVKPFSGRELIARIESRLELRQARKALQAAQHDVVVATSAKAAAEEAARMKDEFLATVSHELGTPLAAMRMWLEVAAGEAERGAAIAALRELVAAQTRMVNDLLDLAAVSNGKLTLKLEELNPNEVVASTADVFRRAAQTKQVAFDVRCDGAPAIRADRLRLQQALSNLLSNAIKFTPAGGRVRLAVGSHRKGARFVVTDTGRGFSEEFKQHLFSPFRQEDEGATRSFAGLGLGLAIARKLVELQGGTVEAASAGLERGSTFTIWFPAGGNALSAGPNRVTSGRRRR